MEHVFDGGMRCALCGISARLVAVAKHQGKAIPECRRVDIVVDEAVAAQQFEEYMSGVRPYLLVRGWTIPNEPKPDHIVEPGHAADQDHG